RGGALSTRGRLPQPPLTTAPTSLRHGPRSCAPSPSTGSSGLDGSASAACATWRPAVRCWPRTPGTPTTCRPARGSSRSTTWRPRRRLRYEAAFIQSPTPAQRADVLRYEVVYEHGGVYLDTDVECLGNIEPLLVDCDAFIGEEPSDLYGNGVFGARRAHPWM